MWEPSQATSDKDMNGLVLLASAGCRLFGERKHRETVYVLCGGKGYRPRVRPIWEPKGTKRRSALMHVIKAGHVLSPSSLNLDCHLKLPIPGARKGIESRFLWLV